MPVFAINFFLIFIWAILTYFLPIPQKKKNLVFLAIIFLQFTFIAWQRDFYVGQDTYGYYRGFLDFSKCNFYEILTNNVNWEPGYKLWNWIIFNLGGDFHTYLLITGAFINFSFLRFVFKYSSLAWLCVVIYVAFGFFAGSLHILRQYLAISIILYSYQFLLEKKLIPFIIIVLIASLFHSSAFPFIVTYFVWQIIPTKKSLLVIIFLLSLIVCLKIGDYLMSLFLFSEKFHDQYFNNDSSGTGYSMLILMFLTMMFGLVMKPKRISTKNQFFYNIYFIALCLQPLATIVSMVSRGIIYWSISITIFLPNIITNIENKNLRTFAYAVVSAGLILFFFIITNRFEGIEIWATYRIYDGQ